MIRRALIALSVVAGLGSLGVVALLPSAVAPALKLPPRLTDGDFWRLSTEWSEEDGYFRSDNLTSNELLFQHVLPSLVRRARAGDVYLGVGPEQNFTYIAAVKPAIAVIVDIRRGNLQLQLMYKALFELGTDRADFVSKLFAKPRPDGLGPESSVVEIFEAFGRSPRSDRLYTQTLQSIGDHLTKTHALPLSAADLNDIEDIYRAFSRNGFAVRHSPTYADLMTHTDRAGVFQSFLASEDRFNVVKKLQSSNLVIPVVGDFAGPKAIRAVGAYLRAHGATVSTFYLSNVEQYLVPDGKWPLFCRNVTSLPLDGSSTFIRSIRGGRGLVGGFGAEFVSRLGMIDKEVENCDLPALRVTAGSRYRAPRVR